MGKGESTGSSATTSVFSPETGATYESLPDALGGLRDMPVWVAWNDEGGRKVPKSPRGGNARSNDPSTWGTYEQAAVARLAADQEKRHANKTMADNCRRDGVRYARAP